MKKIEKLLSDFNADLAKARESMARLDIAMEKHRLTMDKTRALNEKYEGLIAQYTSDSPEPIV